MRSPAAAAVLAAVLAAAPAASAAPPWSAPAGITDAGAVRPDIAFGTGTGGLAAATFGEAGRQTLTLRAGKPEPAGTRRLSGVLDGPHPYGASRTLTLLRRGATGRPTTVGYAFGRLDGSLGTFHPLRTLPLRFAEARLAVAPTGDAVLAFVEERGGASRVFASWRRAGASRFTAPQVLRGTGSSRSVAVAVDARGRFVVAWTRGGGGRRTVEARLGTTARGTRNLQEVGRSLGFADVTAAVAPTGRTTVAWTTRDVGIEQNRPTEVRANVAPAGRTTFAGQVVVDRGAERVTLQSAPSGPSLAAAPDGTTILAYTLGGPYSAARQDAITPVRVSVQDRAARFGAPQELVDDGVGGQAAAREDGTFAVPYVVGAPLEPEPSELRVALREPGATAFAAGELVAADAGGASAAAFEPGPVGAAWVAYLRTGVDGAAVSRRAP
jgi:hypothetical protein